MKMTLKCLRGILIEDGGKLGGQDWHCLLDTIQTIMEKGSQLLSLTDGFEKVNENRVRTQMSAQLLCVRLYYTICELHFPILSKEVRP